MSMMGGWRLQLLQRKRLVSNSTLQIWEKNMDFLNSRLATSLSKIPTWLRWQLFNWTNPIRSTRIIRRFTTETFFILGQVTPCLIPPENLNSYDLRRARPRSSGQNTVLSTDNFLGLVETLGYLTVPGDSVKCFFDYGYSKVRSCTATIK